MPIKLLTIILTSIAKSYLKIYKPRIIAITGNVGKTSTKNAINVVLQKKYIVRSSGGNLNNELGVPLTILGDYAENYYSQGGTILFWAKVIFKGVLGILIPQKYPKFLILEYGADRPGDIEKLANNFKPNIAVVTAVGAIPVHVEFFDNPEALALEKSKLLKFLNADDHAILNADDHQVLEMQNKTIAKVTTFGFNEKSQVRVSDFVIALDDESKPIGVGFKLNHNDSFVPVRLYNSLGQSQALAASAAAAVANVLGINLVETGMALEKYHGPAGRLRILKGIKNSLIIDDTYNSSPASAALALETLKYLPAKRKIAVLGDMLELGKYSEEAHTKIGRLAGEICQVLVCVGDKSKLTSDSALGGINKENIYNFETSEDAKEKILEFIQSGDVILVKGSQGMRMEKIVEVIMAEPERKKELLVRQSAKWLTRV